MNLITYRGRNKFRNVKVICERTKVNWGRELTGGNLHRFCHGNNKKLVAPNNTNIYPLYYFFCIQYRTGILNYKSELLC